MTETKYNVEGLNELSKQVNAFVTEIGFDNADVPLRIALIHSEISEAFEAFRKDRFAEPDVFLEDVILDKSEERFKYAFEKSMKDTFEDEIADSIIRLLDLCGKMNIDIENHIREKMAYNATRGHRYGGKKF